MELYEMLILTLPELEELARGKAPIATISSAVLSVRRAEVAVSSDVKRLREEAERHRKGIIEYQSFAKRFPDYVRTGDRERVEWMLIKKIEELRGICPHCLVVEDDRSDYDYLPGIDCVCVSFTRWCVICSKKDYSICYLNKPRNFGWNRASLTNMFDEDDTRVVKKLPKFWHAHDAWRGGRGGQDWFIQPLAYYFDVFLQTAAKNRIMLGDDET